MEKTDEIKKIEKKSKQVNNKKILKWSMLNLFLILFGASVIINITYVPKYFMLKERGDNALKINITGFNDIENSHKLFLFQYQSTMATLGDLLGQYSENYHLTNDGSLGRYLIGISAFDDQGNHWTLNQDTTKNYYWRIFINGNMSMLGIDSLRLYMNENIELRYQKV